MTVISITETSPFVIYPYGIEPQYAEQPLTNSFFRVGYAGEVEEVHDTQAGRFVLPLLSEMDKYNHTTVRGTFMKSPKLSLPSRRLMLEIVDRFKAEPDVELVANVIWDVNRYDVVWGLDNLVGSTNRFVFVQIRSNGRKNAVFSTAYDNAQTRTGLYGVIGKIGCGLPHARFRMSVGGRFDDVTAPFAGSLESIVWVER